MKNKDGIEIRIGQVFKFEPGVIRTVTGFHRDHVLYVTDFDDGGFVAGCCKPDDNIFHRLISCPVLGNMEDWDIVTEQQKRDYNKPVNQNIGIVPGNLQSFGVISMNGNKKGWYEDNAQHWDDGEIYRVPRGFDWQPYRKDKPAEPEPEPAPAKRTTSRYNKYYPGSPDRYDPPCGCEVEAGGECDHYFWLGGWHSKDSKPSPAKIELLPWDLDYDDLPSSEFRHDVLEKLNEIINHLNKEQ